MILDLSCQYPMVDDEDGRRFLCLPDGRLMEVDFESIHAMASDGSLVGKSEEELRFIRYLCGEGDD